MNQTKIQFCEAIVSIYQIIIDRMIKKLTPTQSYGLCSNAFTNSVVVYFDKYIISYQGWIQKRTLGASASLPRQQKYFFKILIINIAINLFI